MFHKIKKELKTCKLELTLFVTLFPFVLFAVVEGVAEKIMKNLLKGKDYSQLQHDLGVAVLTLFLILGIGAIIFQLVLLIRWILK